MTSSQDSVIDLDNLELEYDQYKDMDGDVNNTQPSDSTEEQVNVLKFTHKETTLEFSESLNYTAL